jgi:eukaryotic-like serine/threonine-protein kinase
MVPRFLSRLTSSGSKSNRVQAHMTFAHTSMSRTVTRTRNFLKKQLWVWPIIAVILLSIAGYAVSDSINRTMKASLESELTTLIQVERAMLEKWFKVQETRALAIANDQTIRGLAAELRDANAKLPADSQSAPTAEKQGSATISELQNQLLKAIESNSSAHEFLGFAVVDKTFRVIASDAGELVGQQVPQYDTFITKTLDGEPTVCPPFPGVTVLKDSAGRMRTGTPTMFVSVPIRDENFQVVAALAMRIRPEKEFTEILQLGRLGESGETYAIDKNGVMLSQSRFDDDLILLGLLADEEGSSSLLNIQVRNPGGDLTKGFRPTVRRAELPLTFACTEAINGSSGVSVEGHADYRGVPCVGAWTWLPKYEMGIITEIDMAEAFRPLTILNWSFYTLYGMLVLSAVAIFVFTVIVARLQHEAQKAAIEAKQLGQYQLDVCLGAGAMGVVYKGHHAMLRRPTAIKMLQIDNINESAISRFEREVQITCKLNHPNTIAIYDFGRTPEGVFYYAMEYLDGIDLQTLVERYGPQPEGRVIEVLLQICGSLYEAHSLGMVHRDIKPANVMLNRRGGEPDVVKVLDFGLVKALDDRSQPSEGSGLSGTPLYMSPESIQTPDLVDGRSDIYAVGAVGYFLLTGEPVFNSFSLTELCQQHIVGVPEPPSKRLGAAVTPALENAILACLEKSRAKRPQTARELAKLLEAVPSNGDWDQDAAEAWWGRHERDLAKAENGNAFKGTRQSSHSRSIASSHSRSSANKPKIAPPPPSGFDRTMVQGDQ